MKKSMDMWVSGEDIVTFQAPTRQLRDHIATRKRSLFWFGSDFGYLPNPDPVLKKQGKDISVYRNLLADPHVGAAVESRKSAVLSLEARIERGKAPARRARLIERAFDSLDLYNVISEILDAPLFGYQPLEVIWKRTGGFWLPADVVGKPPEWFAFDEENRLRFRTRDNYTGEPVPERKFLLPRHHPSYANPYGVPALSRCFWPVTFKRGGMKFWAMFTEKYGMPFLVGRHPRGASEGEIDDMADVLARMIQDAVAVIPDDSTVEVLEARKTSSAEIYEKLLHFTNAEVSKAILGQTLSTEVQDKGSFAAAKAHLEVRKDVIDQDKRLVEATLNELIRWIYELNFGTTDDMPAFKMFEEEEVDLVRAQRDKILVDMGIPLTRKYALKHYNLDEEDVAEFSSPAPARFVELERTPYPDQRAIDRFGNFLEERAAENQAMMEEVLAAALRLVREKKTYTDILENLHLVFPDMESTKLEESLRKAIYIAELEGRASAET